MHSLDALRARIDSIDQELHDLLIERSQVAQSIAAAKGPGEAFLRPGREARILRRLVARHEGPLDPAVLIRIWREILAGNTAIQGPLSVTVGAQADHMALRDMTRDHYGAQTPVESVATPSEAIARVERGEATIAVTPWPALGEAAPWWPVLTSATESGPRIVARLPVLAQAPQPLGAVVAKVPFEDTGADKSLLAVELDEPAAATTAGAVDVVGLRQTDFLGHVPLGSHHCCLVEVDGYVPAGDPRLAETANRCWSVYRVVGLGGYAIPIQVNS